MKTLEQRKATALQLHGAGYNCAQSVILAFSDVTGVADEVAARFAVGMGAGLGQGEMCGVVLGMAAVAGLAGDADTKRKTKAYATVRELTSLFKERNSGCCLCRDLKGSCRRPCDELISDGVVILHNHLQVEK